MTSSQLYLVLLTVDLQPASAQLSTFLTASSRRCAAVQDPGSVDVCVPDALRLSAHPDFASEGNHYSLLSHLRRLSYLVAVLASCSCRLKRQMRGVVTILRPFEINLRAVI